MNPQALALLLQTLADGIAAREAELRRQITQLTAELAAARTLARDIAEHPAEPDVPSPKGPSL